MYNYTFSILISTQSVIAVEGKVFQDHTHNHFSGMAAIISLVRILPELFIGIYVHFHMPVKYMILVALLLKFKL